MRNWSLHVYVTRQVRAGLTVQVSQDDKLLDDVIMLSRLLQHPLHTVK